VIVLPVTFYRKYRDFVVSGARRNEKRVDKHALNAHETREHLLRM